MRRKKEKNIAQITFAQKFSAHNHLQILVPSQFVQCMDVLQIPVNVGGYTAHKMHTMNGISDKGRKNKIKFETEYNMYDRWQERSSTHTQKHNGKKIKIKHNQKWICI